MANIQQTTAREKYWQELRHHIEWTQGFGLYFYFTDNTELLTFFKRKTATIFNRANNPPSNYYIQ